MAESVVERDGKDTLANKNDAEEPEKNDDADMEPAGKQTLADKTEAE